MKVLLLGHFQDFNSLSINKKYEFAINLGNQFKKFNIDCYLVDYGKKLIKTNKSIFKKHIILNRKKLKILTFIELIKEYKYLYKLIFQKPILMRIASGKAKYNLIRRIIPQISPKLIMVWNPHLIEHQLIKKYCERNNIKFLAMEGSLVPGAVDIDENGSQCDSVLIKKNINYKDFTIKASMRQKVESYLEFITKNRLSKKRQENKYVDKDFKKLIHNNKINILLLGMDEVNTGILDFSGETKKCWSPHFKHSADVLDYLSTIYAKKNYSIAYKCHPNMKGKEKIVNENILLVNNTDLYDLIPEVDIVLTIGSSTCIQSILLEKPTILLGTNNLAGKDITYELNHKYELQGLISKALSQSDCKVVKKNLIEYFSFMVSYYTYAYSTEYKKYFHKSEFYLARDVEKYINVKNDSNFHYKIQ